MRFDPSIPIVAIAALLLVLAIVAGVRGASARSAMIRRVLMAVLLVGVALRPVVGSVPIKGAALPVDVVILVDRTNSMGAEDWNGSERRVAGVTADAPELLKVITGARVTVISFDSHARIEMPFVTDSNAVAAILETIGFQASFYGYGSDIGLAVPLALEALTESEQEAPNRTRYLIYMGDGEQTVDTPPTSFEALEPLLTGALVLGYGTEAGGPMKNHRESDYYTTDGKGEPAISRIDEGNLQSIADQLGGEYLHRTQPGPIDFEITFGSAEADDEANYTGGLEIYWIPALGIAALLAWEIWALAPGFRRAREELS